MIDFLTYVFSETKARRLSKSDAFALIGQYQAFADGSRKRLHPLVHRNTSDLSGQKYSSTFSGEEFFLKDHVVQGQKVLPGVAQLELAREAVRLASGEQKQAGRVRLENVVFARPIVVDGGSLEVHIALEVSGADVIAFEIYSGEGEDVVLYSQGRAVLTNAEAPQAWSLDLLRSECCEYELGAAQCYETFGQFGLAYGPAMRTVERLSAGRDSQEQALAMGELRLPANVKDSLEEYGLHPSLMDGALQSSIGLKLGMTADDSKPSLPFAVESVEGFRPLQEQAWVAVRYSKGSHADAAIQKLDVDILDDQGNVCVRIQGFSSRVVEAVSAPASIRTALLQPHWARQDMPADAAAPQYAAHWVVLCEIDKHIEPAVGAALPQASCVRLASEADLLDQRYTDYASQLLQQIQHILADKPQDEVLIQLVVPMAGEAAVLRGLGGLLKSAQQENPKLHGQIIAIDGGNGAQEAIDQIKTHMLSPAQEVRHSSGQWQVLQLEEAVSSETNAHPWKDAGVYLITGGAGGVGLLFAQQIASQARHVKLVLTGRSQPSDAIRAHLDVLKSLGAHAEYHAVDVSDARQVKELVQTIVKTHGALNGVIHCAGVLRSSLIARKTLSELQDVLAPKVAGVKALDEATRDLSLDLLVLCSSLSGQMGNIGQADYAAANAFMDAYAQYRNELVKTERRSGHTVSMGWPLWEEGGMEMDASTREQMWRGAGLVPLPTQAAMQALYQALGMKAAHVLVFHGDVKRMIKTAVQATAPAQADKQTAAAESVDSGELLSKVEAALVAGVSKLLKINEEEIDLDVEFSEFGFDSISLTHFGNALNEKYGVDLSPTIFFEYSTINALAGHFVREYQEAFASGLMTPKSPAAVPSQAAQQEPQAAPALGKRRRANANPVTPATRTDAGLPEPVAIIGVSGSFPQSDDLDALWENLKNGRDCITDIPAERWNNPEEFVFAKAGLIEGIDRFDPLFFGISPREAEGMDPQQRLLMTYVWKVIEDAGYAPQSLSGTNTAIFVGTADSGYSDLLAKAGGAIEGSSATGVVVSIGPSRMSYMLNLHGPSEPIETACSSSLVAIHRAMMTIQAGHCEMAIVGGINTLLSPEMHISFAKAGMLSDDGRCKTFSNKANGYVRGEGVGMLLLKKLSAAERDGDHIYAVIRGSAENHGGRANSLTAPNPRAQAELIKTAFSRAGVDPKTVSYIEAHGTGTSLGDPIEVQGVMSAFKELARNGEALPEAYCGLGSIKTNIGHLELAAGIAGVIKILLQLKHKTLVKSLHCDEINPYINLKGSPFYIVQEERPWEALKDEQGRELPRRAGVSSFGFGGVNAHVVIEEYIAPRRSHRISVTPANPAMIVLSAKNEERLQDQAAQMLSVLESGRFKDEDLADIAYTLQVGREAMDARLACVAHSMASLIDKLTLFVHGDKRADELYLGHVKRNKEALAMLTGDDDLNKVVANWIAGGKVSKLADLWVKGLALDWNALYAESKPRRISLPTYPFAQERYWVPQTSVPQGEARLQAEKNPAAASLPDPAIAAAERPSEPYALLTFEESWEEESIESKSSGGNIKLVCFLSDQASRQRMRDAIASTAPQAEVIFVSRPTQSQDTDRYTVSSHDKRSYEDVLTRIRADHGAIDAVLYLWPLEARESATDIKSVVYLIQALAQADIGCKRLMLVGQSADATAQAHFESWIGIERSLGFVWPSAQVSVLLEKSESDAPSFEAEKWAARIMAELANPRAQSVLYSLGKRHVSRVQPLTIESETSRIRRGGTYLLTGGCGGLGLMFAKYLARQYAAKLVLTGRSALNENKERALQALRAEGAEVLYLQADVADKEDMQAALRQIEERFGLLDGVIHAAGVERMDSILEKDIAQFEEVTVPKIQGCLVLDQLLRDHPLDFVCYFSSSSATLGDSGACDYAVANRFLMAYAKARNSRVKRGDAQGRTSAICWPLWKEGGMGFSADEQTCFYLQTSGQRGLETEEGMEIFERILARGIEHPLVIAGQPTRVNRFLKLTAEVEQQQSTAVSDQVVGKGRPSHLKGLTLEQCVAWDLKEQASQFLKIARERLDPQENLADFGFDSISLAEFAKRLHAYYGIEILPSVFFSHPTLEQFGRHLLKGHRLAMEAFYQEASIKPHIQAVSALPKPAAGRSAVTAAPARGEIPAARTAEGMPKPDQSSGIDEPIAIVGMSGRFPGARSVDELWRVLHEGRDMVAEIPQSRFDWRKYYGDPLKQSGKTNGKWLGAVPGVDEFDPLFFEISPVEAEAMDPRQRLLLQEAWRALEDAGYGGKQIGAHKIGTFVGVEQGDYQFLENGDANITANHDGVLAARLAYFLNLHGPTMAINTACSSSLVAAHQACLSLRARECDAAIVAGVSLLLTPQAFVGMGQAGMLSPDGKCHAFDKKANGMVPGEAVVAVVLKRLSQAQADGDPIHAVIQGSGINYDGKTNGITAPSGASQARLLEDVYSRYRVDPSDLDYIVSHGTGTRLGDPIEINALCDAFKPYTEAQGFCAITSTKSNLGHTLAASGLVSLVSLVKAMQNETIPKSLHCDEESDYVTWDKSPFFVNKEAKPWPRTAKPRLGAVSAFGMSGTNAHIVVQSYDAQPAASNQADLPCYLLVLSARSEGALREKANDLAAALRAKPWRPDELLAMSYTLLTGRHHFEHRCAIVVQDKDDALEKLQALGSKENLPNCFRNRVARGFTPQSAIAKYGEELLVQASGLTHDMRQYQENLQAVADLYCQGYALDWEKLYADANPTRISLPHYPFARERYWVSNATEQTDRDFMVSEIYNQEEERTAMYSQRNGVPTGMGAPQVMSPVLAGEEEKSSHATNAKAVLSAEYDSGLLRAKTLQRVKEMFARISKHSMANIDVQEPLERYGIDSMMIAKLNQQLIQVFGELSNTLFFEYQNLDALAGYLVRDHAATCARWCGMAERAAAGPTVKNASMPAQVQKTSHQPMHDTRKATKARQEDGGPEREPIAIIGLSGRYPQARTVGEFWANLSDGQDCITVLPSERWSLEGFFNPNMQAAMAQGQSYSKWGGFVDGFCEFDPLFFNIAPSEAENIDPQERLFLQCAYATLEDAGYTKQRVASAYQGKVGVFAGITTTGFDLHGPEIRAQGQPFFPHTSFCSLANRVSYLMDFHGPSIPIDTMCSASLTAIHEACLHLQMGECEMAIAGGVNLLLHPYSYIGRSLQRMLSADGHCKSFGLGGDGYVPGEGVGAALLKPLSKAIEDGDQIYGVIKASAINHGGKTNGYTVPNPNAQAQLISDAVKQAGIHPRAISYIEAHGTGTALGDPIEITGLSKAFGEHTQDKQYCAIGSVKSNIGHCESAAGMAGLTKILLQMKHGMLVKSLHSEELNPNIDFGKTPFVVQQETAPWERPVLNLDGQKKEYPRIAGLSSFGAGGANAHLIIEEYIPPVREKLPVSEEQPAVIVLSAKNEERLKAQVSQLLSTLRKGELTDEDVMDVAYTLQVGREAMDMRLACVVTGMEQLQDKLSAYLRGEKEVEELYCGDVKRNKEALALFISDEELQAEAVARWMRRGSYGKLAEVWSKGLLVDWAQLYGEFRPQRISLPTYPFAKDRYWLPQIDTPSTTASQAAVSMLHPLVQRNTSSFRGQRFSSTFSGEEFFLRDHVVQGKKVLPGAAQLEMAREAAKQSAGMQEAGTQVCLENVVFAKPVVIGDSALEVHIALSLQADESAKFEIYSNSGNEKVVHSQGRAVFAALGQAPSLHVAELQSLCTAYDISSAQCYEAYTRMGITYGAAFQGVQRIRAGRDEAGSQIMLSELQLPPAVTQGKEAYVLHPSILDAALQSAIGLMLGVEGEEGKPALPFALERMEMFAPLPDKAWVLGRYSEGSHAGATVRKLDLDIADDSGRICARLRSFSSRVLQGGSGNADIQTLLLRPQWSQQPKHEDNVAIPQYAAHWVVLCEIEAEAKAAIDAILPGAQLLKLSSPKTALAQRYTDYAEQLLQQVQDILASKPQGHVLIQLVVPTDGENLLMRGLNGLLKSAQIEHSKLLVHLLALESNVDAQTLCERLKQQMTAPAQDVRYVAGECQMVRLEEVAPPVQHEHIWKDEGVYLITGGLGGLGLVFAQEIASRARNVTLVLTGRSQLSEEMQVQLDVLRSLGAHVEYHAVDVSKQMAVQELVDRIKGTHGRINGVLHCAGVLRDNFIVKKTAAELREVFAPKVEALVALDEATQNLALDCFVLFSSTSSVMGNMGQADYAAANAFMDTYAEYRNTLVKEGRRQGHTLTVNWSLWESGGMQVDANTREHMWRNGGLAPLPTEAGVQALNQAIALGDSQIVVFSGDANRLRKAFSAPDTPPKVKKQPKEVPAAATVTAATAATATAVDEGLLQTKITAALVESVSEILKIKREDIDVETEFTEFGFDSITLMGFSNALNEKFGLELSPIVFFEYPSLESLAEHLVSEHQEELAPQL